MIRLVTADAPGVVCLQELPVWSLDRLAAWSGMQAFGDVARPPLLRSAELGRVLTDLHHGLLRSAVTGQANAILLAPGLAAPERWWSLLSTPGQGERRILQAVRIETLGIVGNTHLTSGVAAEQLRGARALMELYAHPDTPVVLCGDFNLRPVYDDLDAHGFSAPAPGIDQILVRGLPASQPMVWPEERRRVDGRLLSDHAPVELIVG